MARSSGTTVLQSDSLIGNVTATDVKLISGDRSMEQSIVTPKGVPGPLEGEARFVQSAVDCPPSHLPLRLPEDDF